MPFAEVTGGTIHYRLGGEPDALAPVLVLSHPLGADLSMWDWQLAALGRSFKILRYDSRGHGRSLVTSGPYTIELLARDVVGLLDRLELRRVHFCGLSLGAMVGMWLGAHEPARVDRLVLANTAARLGSPEFWAERIESIRHGGMTGVADRIIERWFTPAFRERCPADVDTLRQALLAVPPDGYIACCAAIRDMDLLSDLASIRAPALVIAGQDDPATPPAACRVIAGAIPGARLVELAASHLSNIEAAEAFSAAVREFLLE